MNRYEVQIGESGLPDVYDKVTDKVAGFTLMKSAFDAASMLNSGTTGPETFAWWSYA